MSNQLERYLVKQFLGKGGMGMVHRAYDRLLQTDVALKRVKVGADSLDFHSKVDGSNPLVSLTEEFRTLATLRHPYIVSVIDYGFDVSQQPFYTMTLVEEASTIIDYAQDQTQSEMVRLLIQLLQAVDYLHRSRVLHRDLKPDNVLIDTQGNVKVMDFGLALAMSGSQRQNRHEDIAGTIAYIAPECLRGEGASYQSVLYAVGVIAYELLQGEFPYPRGNIPTLISAILTTDPEIHHLDYDLSLWLQRLLSKDPHYRYASAYAALVALCEAPQPPLPAETEALRESYLQASNFVGREAEFSQLKTMLTMTKADDTAFALIGGESGVGKTRLVEEVRVRALTTGFAVVQGQAISSGSLPFQLWRGIARQLLLTTTISDTQLGILKEIVPEVDQIVGRPIAKAPEINGAEHHNRLVRALVQLIKTQTSPLLIVLEDLQWVSESLLPLQELLKQQDSLSQVMVIATYRSDEHPNLIEKLPTMTHLTLDRLKPDEVATLSGFMLGERGLNQPIVDLMARESEGNPFFIIEIVRALALEAGSLRSITSDSLPKSIITSGMTTLLQKRLAQIPDHYRQSLELAAVMGRQLDETSLCHINETLQWQDFIYTGHLASVFTSINNEWQFAHDKLRETVLANIGAESRRAYHRQIALAIETLYPDDPDRHEMLLTHWQGADDAAKIITYRLKIGHRDIVQHSQIQQGIDNLASLRTDYATHLTDEDRARLLNDLALAYFYAGQRDLAHQAVNEAQTIGKRLEKVAIRIQTQHLVGMLTYSENEYEKAIAIFEACLQMAQAQNKSQLIAQSYNNLMLTHRRIGNYDQAIAYGEKSCAIYRQIGNTYGESYALNNLSAVYLRSGQREKALDYIHKSRELSRIVDNLQGIATASTNLGSHAFFDEDFQAAYDHYMEAATQYRSINTRRSEAVVLANAAKAAALLGRCDEAITLNQQAYQIHLASGEAEHILSCELSHLWFSIMGDNPYQRDDFKIILQQVTEAQYTRLYELTVRTVVWLYYREDQLATCQTWLHRIMPIYSTDMHPYFAEILDNPNLTITVDLSQNTASDDVDELLQQIIHELATDWLTDDSMNNTIDDAIPTA